MWEMEMTRLETTALASVSQLLSLAKSGSLEPHGQLQGRHPSHAMIRMRLRVGSLEMEGGKQWQGLPCPNVDAKAQDFGVGLRRLSNQQVGGAGWE